MRYDKRVKEDIQGLLLSLLLLLMLPASALTCPNEVEKVRESRVEEDERMGRKSKKTEREVNDCVCSCFFCYSPCSCYFKGRVTRGRAKGRKEGAERGGNRKGSEKKD